MKAAWAEIERLVKANATHRSGARLQELSKDDILIHARRELAELRDAPDDPTELADVIACLFHYAIKSGWTMDQIEQLVLEKLKLRFSEENR